MKNDRLIQKRSCSGIVSRSVTAMLVPMLAVSLLSPMLLDAGTREADPYVITSDTTNAGTGGKQANGDIKNVGSLGSVSGESAVDEYSNEGGLFPPADLRSRKRAARSRPDKRVTEFQSGNAREVRYTFP